MKNSTIIAAFVLLLLVVSSLLSPVSARTFALVVGINKYQHFPNLAGAVDDAKDIASTLKRTGAVKVKRFINGEATYRSIRAAWRKMMTQARRGDTLIFSYAGHGGQEPQAIPGSETDKKDETFLLGGFYAKTAKGRRERIVDNEINAWFRQAGAKGLRVIFIADSCHSGTMTRDINENVHLSVRSLSGYGLPEDEEPSEDSKHGAMLSPNDLPHVTFFAATQEGSKVSEITIDGHTRGALSWAFARALEQGADRNHDGVLTRSELRSYLLPKVQQVSEARQSIDMIPRSVEHDQPLLKLTATGRKKPMSTRLLRVTVLKHAAPQKLVASLQGAVGVGRGEAPDLVYDAGKREVISGKGDMVAQDISPAFLQGVVDKWRALPGLKQMVVARPLSVSLSPDDGRHPDGQTIGFSTEPVHFPHLTVINLTPDGLVKYLYPLEGDPPRWTVGKLWQLDLRAMGPFGADHLLIIASSRPLDGLQAQLLSKGMSGLPSLLEERLRGMEYQIGLKGLYTWAGEGRE